MNGYAVGFLYSLLFYLLVPFILLRLAYKGRRVPGYRSRWRERFALQPIPESERGAIWVHAVSVGEVEAVVPLIRALQARGRVLLTTTTPTGSARVQSLFGNTVSHVYLPYDLPDAVQRFLDGYRPPMAIFMELEIWPNLFAGCGKRAIPLFLINARLSEKSARGYRRLPGFVAATLANVTRLCAQGETDAARFAALGLPADRIVVTGSIKFDLELPEDLPARGRLLRASLFGQRPVWIAASTHAGEEEQVLEVFQGLRRDYPDLLLLLAPRHPERASEICSLCRQRGLRYLTRTAGMPCTSDTAVFILDTLGELKQFYGAGDIAFIGGSLVPAGGHNVLEPAALGVPILFGPLMDNFIEISRKLLAEQGAVQISHRSELSDEVSRLLADPAARERLGENARRFLTANRGALQATLRCLPGAFQKD
ncbi:MAG TPA: lipid IV(A) 3-deoxy-D-manno-octulosonic acid transferase [Methylococcaceae bacterium]|nr:lipid IV(A) 3-deoxy-D-manno-octulosonic acid transferase [Methylococcaceae bacterium]